MMRRLAVASIALVRRRPRGGLADRARTRTAVVTSRGGAVDTGMATARRALMVTIAIGAGCGQPAPPATPPMPTSMAPRDAPRTPIVAAPVAAPAPVDAFAQLVAIGDAALATPPSARPEGPRMDDADAEIPANGPCLRPTAAEKAALATRLEAWSVRAVRYHVDWDRFGPIGFGCVERGGLVVDVSRHVNHRAHQRGHWWTLRVSPRAIEVLDHVEGDSMDYWSEGSRENYLRTLMLVDLDGDGALDPVRARVEHEGSAPYDEVVVTTGARPLAVGHAVGAVWVASPQPPPTARTLVLGIEVQGEDRVVFRCVTSASAWAPCPAAAPAERIAARAEAASQLVSATSDVLDDPELLAAHLALLEVPEATRAPLLAEAWTRTTPFDAVIARFRRGLDDGPRRRTVDEQAVLDQRARAALTRSIRAALGEPACPPATAAQRRAATAAITSWIGAHERGASRVRVTPGCPGAGKSYWYASWRRPRSRPTRTPRCAPACSISALARRGSWSTAPRANSILDRMSSGSRRSSTRPQRQSWRSSCAMT